MQFGSAVAVTAALIRPLPWELPYATGVALKKKKKNPCNEPYQFFFLMGHAGFFPEVPLFS